MLVRVCVACVLGKGETTMGKKREGRSWGGGGVGGVVFSFSTRIKLPRVILWFLQRPFIVIPMGSFADITQHSEFVRGR